MSSWWSTICFLMILFLYSLSLGSNNKAFANNTLPASFQHPKQLCHDQEKLALLQFKQSLLIDCAVAAYPTSAYPKVKSWLESSSDKHGTTLADCCRWDGVKCNMKTGHVIGLDLSNSCLYGTLLPNSTIFKLGHLQELNLAGNCFNYSQIPSAIGHLYKLTSLNLSQSAFSGQIPSEIVNLSSLSVLDLSYNVASLGGVGFNLELHDPSLEKLVRNLPRLTQLHLDNVDISSPVPAIISNRTSLKAITLSNCNLLGKLPTMLFQLPKLQVVALYSNHKLGGYLPEFGYSSPLGYLSLSETEFSGQLPASLGNLGSLEILDLWDCEFFGSLPFSLGNLTRLTYLSLGYNNFRGDLPSSIMNLTALSTLLLSDGINVRAEILESWLPKLSTLTQLAIHDMSLGSKIPPALANLTTLTYLDLSNSQLTGPLPHWFLNLTQLSCLDLYGNMLQGSIPSWLSHLKNLNTLFLSFEGSVGMFDTFLKLPKLRSLMLYGVNLTFPPNIKTNSSLLKFGILGIDSGNLTEFPQLLHYQDELQFLSLSKNSIAGDIPQWFVNITRENLLSLDLENNLLTSFEQPLVSLPWNNLEVLNLNGNKLQGLLPTPPSSMQIYQVNGNRFFGAIPKLICHASSLFYLDLSNNTLSGQIPGCIGHQLGDSLQVLNLRGNSFSGTIPQNFSSSCKLKMINLSQNQLKGELPKSLLNCTMLQVLDVGKNGINDTFPSWLGGLRKLQVLVLRHNNFHGRIANPELHGGFRSLRVIDLSSNFHTGDLPARYFKSWLAMRASNENQSESSNSIIKINFSILGLNYPVYENYLYSITISNKGRETFYSRILVVFRVIDLSNNFFFGEIPDVLGDLMGLQALNLSHNHLVGGIPSSLANVRDLESLDISQNMLSEGIPQQLTELTFLAVFNVSHNNLMGPIPQGNQFNTFDNTSFVENSGLCGAPLSKRCENSDSLPLPPPPSMNDDETEEDSKYINWIIRSLGCATGFIVGFIVGKIYITDRHHDWFMETFRRKERSKTRARKSAPSRRRN